MTVDRRAERNINGLGFSFSNFHFLIDLFVQRTTHSMVLLHHIYFKSSNSSLKVTGEGDHTANMSMGNTTKSLYF